MADSATGDTARLIAELWYPTPPDLEDPALLAALRQVSPRAEMQDRSYTVPHTEVTLELEQGQVPLLTAVLAGSPLESETKSRPDVSQTWDWAEAAAVVQQCTASVLVTEMLAGLFPPQQRVTGLMSVLQVLVDLTRPLAIHWPHSQRVTDPATFDPESLDGVLNVRFFTVGETGGGGPGAVDEATTGGAAPGSEAMVMDTLGLDLFGLPDAQCHYRDYPPADVAALLFTTAAYVFAEGDVIDDGHTISGPRGDERFVCRHEQALIAPARQVLDVDLGDPYAAGARRR